MNSLVLDGSRKNDNSLVVVYEVIVDVLKSQGCQIDSYILRDEKIANCAGCFGCWIRTPGICVINDTGREIAKIAAQSDLIVFLTPLTFGGYSSELKKALDRMIGLISPFFLKINGEYHHKSRYKKNPKLLGVAITQSYDDESSEIFETLVKQNAVNFHSPASAAGVLKADQDKETTLKTIRTLLDEIVIRS